MDARTFVVEMSQALGWPVTVAGLAIAFQSQVRVLLQRLSRLKAPGGVEVDFGAKLDHAADTLPVEAKKQLAEAPIVPPLRFEAGLPAGYVIIQSWNKLEERLRAVSIARGLRDRRGTYHDARLIAGKLGLDPSMIQSINTLRSIRNDAAHGKGGEPTTTDALRFVDLVEEVLKSLPDESPSQLRGST